MNHASKPSFVYAANRQIGYRSLQLLLENGLIPEILMLPNRSNDAIIDSILTLLPDTPVIFGQDLNSISTVELLKSFDLDYILSVHFPLILTPDILNIPSIGVLNLHPAYLPYNRGWHTPTWAILDNTIYGATLHWVNKEIDGGDIAIQDILEISPDDTAHTLYQKVLDLELDILKRAIPSFINGTLPRIPQQSPGTLHRKNDIGSIQKIDLDSINKTGDVINQLRALTTNDIREAAFFEENGIRYRIIVTITEDN